MPLEISMTGSTIADCGGGISVGGECSKIVMVDSRIERCDQAIVQRDSAEALAALGLTGVPNEIIIEAVKALLERQEEPVENKQQMVRESRLGVFIQHSADATTLIQGLVALTPPLLQGLLALLGG